MIKRDELRGPSCLTKAADDEPLFVLRANDELASAVVRFWAVRYYDRKGAAMTETQRQKYHEALALANEMETWKSTDRDAMNK